MLQAADTVGVFQVESRAQMQTLPKSRPATPRRPGRGGRDHPAGPDPGQRRPPVPAPQAGPRAGDLPPPEPRADPRATRSGVILYQEQVMKIAIEVAGFTPAGSDGFRRAMGTWRSEREMEKLHAQFVEGCAASTGSPPDDAEELFRRCAAFASFGFAKSPRRGVRPDRLRVGVPQAVLPGPVPGRADQRPADGLLPGRGARQRREAPRGRGPAGRRQRVALQDDDRVGGAARLGAGRGRGDDGSHDDDDGRAAARGLRGRPPAATGPLARVRHPGRRGARPLGGRDDDRLGRPAGAAPRQGDRRGARGAPRRGAGPRAVHEPRRRRRADRAARGGDRAADPGRGAGLARAGRGASCCGSCARWPARRAAGSTGETARHGASRLARPPGGRWTCGCRRPRRRRCRRSPRPSGSGDAYAVVGLDARRQVVGAVPADARAAGRGAERGARGRGGRGGSGSAASSSPASTR